MTSSAIDRLLSFVVVRRRQLIASYVSLIIANALPMAGVLFFSWNVFFVLIVFWFESFILGVFNVIKMLMSGIVQEKGFSIGRLFSGLFFSAFFTVHYGGFMTVHLIFLVVIAGVTGIAGSMQDPFIMLKDFVLGLPRYLSGQAADPVSFITSAPFAVGLIFVSACIYFASTFLRTKEYVTRQPEDFMTEPYGRIIVMHCTIIFGMLAFVFCKSNAAIMAVFILLKLAFDIYQVNRRELKREKAAAQTAAGT